MKQCQRKQNLKIWQIYLKYSEILQESVFCLCEDAEVDPYDIFKGKKQPGGRADKVKQTHILPPQKLTFSTKWNTTQISTAIETVMA